MNPEECDHSETVVDQYDRSIVLVVCGEYECPAMGVQMTSCSWCDELNPMSERLCRDCGHEAHVSRMMCTCRQCGGWR